MEDSSQLLSRLGINGVTSTGGSAQFKDFLIRLDADGIVPIGALPVGGGGQATNVAFTPAGNIAATNVSAALIELDTEKVAITDFNAHTANLSNPHSVTKSQVGLSNVANVDTTDAGNISSGLLPNARLNASVTLLGNSFNGNSQLVQLSPSGLLPAVSGINLTALNASNLSTGTIPNGRFPATLPAVSGANLTNIPTTSLTGTIPDARFPSTLPAVSGANLTNITGANIIGTINGSVFPSVLPTVSGVNLTNLSAANIQGTLPGATIPNPLPAVSGANLTNLSASAINAGLLSSTYLDSAIVTKQGNTFNIANKLVKLDGTGRLPAVDGSQLTNLSVYGGITDIAGLRVALEDAVNDQVIELTANTFVITGTSLISSLDIGVTGVKIHYDHETVFLYDTVELAAEDRDLFVGSERNLKNFGLVANDASGPIMTQNVKAWNTAKATCPSNGGHIFNDGSDATFASLHVEEGTYYFNDTLHLGGRQALKNIGGIADFVFGDNFAPAAGRTIGTFDAANGTLTSGSISTGSFDVTVASTTSLIKGMAISGHAGIPAGSFVQSITNATTFVLSQAATDTASGLTLDYNAINLELNSIAIELPKLAHMQRVRFTTTGTLPAPLQVGNDYWVFVGHTNRNGFAPESGPADQNIIRLCDSPLVGVKGVLNLTTLGTGTHTLVAMERFGMVIDKANSQTNSNTVHFVDIGDLSLSSTNTNNAGFSGIAWRSAQLSVINKLTIAYKERGFVSGEISSSLICNELWLAGYNASGGQGSVSNKPALQLDNVLGLTFHYIHITLVNSSGTDVYNADGIYGIGTLNGDVPPAMLLSNTLYCIFGQLAFEAVSSGIKIIAASHYNSIETLTYSGWFGSVIAGSYALCLRGHAQLNFVKKYDVFYAYFAIKDYSELYTDGDNNHEVPATVGSQVVGAYNQTTTYREVNVLNKLRIGEGATNYAKFDKDGVLTVHYGLSSSVLGGESFAVSNTTNSSSLLFYQNTLQVSKTNNTGEIWLSLDNASLTASPHVGGFRVAGGASDSLALSPHENNNASWLYLSYDKGRGIQVSNAGTATVAISARTFPHAGTDLGHAVIGKGEANGTVTPGVLSVGEIILNGATDPDDNTAQITINQGGNGALCCYVAAINDSQVIFDATYTSGAFVAKSTSIARLTKNNGTLTLQGSTGNTIDISAVGPYDIWQANLDQASREMYFYGNIKSEKDIAALLNNTHLSTAGFLRVSGTSTRPQGTPAALTNTHPIYLQANGSTWSALWAYASSAWKSIAHSGHRVVGNPTVGNDYTQGFINGSIWHETGARRHYSFLNTGVANDGKWLEIAQNHMRYEVINPNTYVTTGIHPVGITPPLNNGKLIRVDVTFWDDIAGSPNTVEFDILIENVSIFGSNQTQAARTYGYTISNFIFQSGQRIEIDIINTGTVPGLEISFTYLDTIEA